MTEVEITMLKRAAIVFNELAKHAKTKDVKIELQSLSAVLVRHVTYLEEDTSKLELMETIASFPGFQCGEDTGLMWWGMAQAQLLKHGEIK